MQTNNEYIDLTKTSSYDYDLPKELIAQDPAEPRDSSRLLVVSRGRDSVFHNTFRNIGKYLKQGDLLVMNDTRVLPARLYGRKKDGSANVEIFVLQPLSSHVWTALVKPGKKLKPGAAVILDGRIEITIGERLEDGLRKIEFSASDDPLRVIHEYGTVPLPHYITDTRAEPERYQTVYSRLDKENSVAAPTAGLHFTPELLSLLRAGGIKTAFVTLQVGLGTFRPVKAEDISEHIMHNELCEINDETAETIRETKKSGGRVIAVGTTVVRTLESFAKEFGEIRPGIMDTRLFIHPGFEFKVIDGLITNFHLPKSTLLMLVSAFGGYETMMSAYRTAVEERYRFFSFGDSMFIS